MRTAETGLPTDGPAPVETSLYRNRFTKREDAARIVAWAALGRFFQRWIPPQDTVMDVGTDDGQFLRNVTAAHKIGVDLNPEAAGLQIPGVEAVVSNGTDFARHVTRPVDVIFISNFLEHLPHKGDVVGVLKQCQAVLRPGGRVMILQPNIRYVGAAYWDYIDHHIALTEHSLTEALIAAGFAVDVMIPRFLPYTVKSPVWRFAGLTGLYLKLPLLWRIFGQQTFVVAHSKPGWLRP